jgi:hypothetical protein
MEKELREELQKIHSGEMGNADLAHSLGIPFNVNDVMPDFKRAYVEQKTQDLGGQIPPASLSPNPQQDVNKKMEQLAPLQEGLQSKPDGMTPDPKLTTTEDTARGMVKGVAKVGEAVANVPAKTWNLFMEASSLTEKALGLKGTLPGFYESQKVPTFDFGIERPLNDNERAGQSIAEFSAQLAAGMAATVATGGSYLAGNVAQAVTGMFLLDPNDPKFIPNATKFVGAHFGNTEWAQPLAKAMSSLENGIDNSPDDNEEVRMFKTFADQFAIGLGFEAAATAGIKGVGYGIIGARKLAPEMEKALTIIKNQRGVVGAGGGDLPPVLGTDLQNPQQMAFELPKFEPTDKALGTPEALLQNLRATNPKLLQDLEAAGYDTSKIYFHGTPAEFSGLPTPSKTKPMATYGLGSYYSDNPRYAGEYTGNPSKDPGKLIPVFLKKEVAANAEQSVKIPAVVEAMTKIPGVNAKEFSKYLSKSAPGKAPLSSNEIEYHVENFLYTKAAYPAEERRKIALSISQELTGAKGEIVSAGSFGNIAVVKSDDGAISIFDRNIPKPQGTQGTEVTQPQQLELPLQGEPKKITYDVPAGERPQKPTPPDWKNPLEGMSPSAVMDEIMAMDITKLKEKGQANLQPVMEKSPGAGSVLAAAQGKESARNRWNQNAYNSREEAIQHGIEIYTNPDTMEKLLAGEAIPEKGTAGAMYAIAFEALDALDKSATIAITRTTDLSENVRFMNQVKYGLKAYGLYESLLSNSSHGLSSKQSLMSAAELKAVSKKGPVKYAEGAPTPQDLVREHKKLVTKDAVEKFVTMNGGEVEVREAAVKMKEALQLANGDYSKFLRVVNKELKNQKPNEFSISRAVNEFISQNLTSGFELAATSLGYGIYKEYTDAVFNRVAAFFQGTEGEKVAAREAMRNLPGIPALVGETISAITTYYRGLMAAQRGETAKSLGKYSEIATPKDIPMMSSAALTGSGSVFEKAPGFGTAMDVVNTVSRGLSPFLPTADLVVDHMVHSGAGTRAAFEKAYSKGFSPDEATKYVSDILKERPVVPPRPVKPDAPELAELPPGASPVEIAKAQQEFDAAKALHKDSLVQYRADMEKWKGEMSEYTDKKEVWDFVDSAKQDAKLMRDVQKPVEYMDKHGDTVSQWTAGGVAEKLLRLIPFSRAFDRYSRPAINVAQNAFDLADSMVPIPIIGYLSPRNLAKVQNRPIEAKVLRYKAAAAWGLMGLGYALTMGQEENDPILTVGRSVDPNKEAEKVAKGIRPDTFFGMPYRQMMGEMGVAATIGAYLGQARKYYDGGHADPRFKENLDKLEAQMLAALGQVALPDLGMAELYANTANDSLMGKEKVLKQLSSTLVGTAVRGSVPGSGLFTSLKNLADPYQRVSSLSGIPKDMGTVEKLFLMGFREVMNMSPFSSSNIAYLRDFNGDKIAHEKGIASAYRDFNSVEDMADIRNVKIVNGAYKPTRAEFKTAVWKLMNGEMNQLVTYGRSNPEDRDVRLNPLPWRISVPGTSEGYDLTPQEREALTLKSVGRYKGYINAAYGMNQNYAEEDKKRGRKGGSFDQDPDVIDALFNPNSSIAIQTNTVEGKYRAGQKQAVYDFLLSKPDLYQKYEKAIANKMALAGYKEPYKLKPEDIKIEGE